MQITEQEQKQIDYFDQAIKQMLTPKQEFKIAKDIQDRINRKRKKLIKEISEKKEPKQIYINSLSKWVKEADISEEMIEAEQSLGEKVYF